MTCNDNSYPRKQARHKMSTSLLEEHNIRFMVWVIQYHFYSLQWRTATLIVIKRHFHLSNMKKYYIVYRSGNLIPLLTLTEVELFKKSIGNLCSWNQRITEINVSLAARNSLPTWTNQYWYSYTSIYTFTVDI